MKRKLTIFLDSSNYTIKSNDDKAVTIKTDNLVLRAQDLYEQFFFDASMEEPMEMEVEFDNSATVGVAEKKVCEKIKEVIDLIVSGINNAQQKSPENQTNAGDKDD